MKAPATIKIHDLPIKYPTEGVSFHASEYPVRDVWWDGKSLEVVDHSGTEWEFDFVQFSWGKTR